MIAISIELLRRRLVAMTEFELAAAAAGTRLVGRAFGVFGGQVRHDFGRRPPAFQELPHHLHRGTGVGEEQFKPGAEIVMTRLAIPGRNKPVLWTSAVAEEPHLALLTLPGRRVSRVLAE